MDKGVRPAVKAHFLQVLPTRENTRLGNTKFRATVIHKAMEDFGITLAAAATHYNHAFIKAKEASLTNPELAAQLVGLGRPEDKKGGRKKKVVEVPAAGVATTEVAPVVTDGVAATTDPVAQEQAAQAAEALAGTAAAETATGTADAVPSDAAPQEQAATAKIRVVKKSDGTLVAEVDTQEEADALIAANKKAKKAALKVAE